VIPGVGVEAQQGRASTEMGQQPTGPSGVFRRNHRYCLKHLRSPVRQVAQVAQWRSYDVEGARAHGQPTVRTEYLSVLTVLSAFSGSAEMLLDLSF
jgi:hypothetical protein